MLESSANQTWAGNCAIDIDECASAPCANDAICFDSIRDHQLPVHSFRCLCRPGFADGWCEYDFITEYEEQCALSTGGRCQVDVDECALECWKHGSLFDLETGVALTLPAVKPVAVHVVEVIGDDVHVALAEGAGS